MSGTRAIATTSRHKLSSSFFSPQGKAPKEIHAIPRETLSCFLPGQAKDLSAPVVVQYTHTHKQYTELFFLYFANRASQYIYLNINQLDALNFKMSLFHASTSFEHMCSSSGGQNCTIQPLVSSH